MEYLAHLNENGKEQMLFEHLKNTAVLSGNFADTDCNRDIPGGCGHGDD